MRPGRLNRRRFLITALLAAPGLAAIHARWLEPKWLKTRRLRLSREKPTHRFVHFTDVHYRGDRAYLETVVQTINALSPDFVCFTGDLIDDTAHLTEALGLIAGIKSPVFGVPGNHDYWTRVPFDAVAKCLAGTGGAWLLDQQRVTADGKVTIIGASCLTASQPPIAANPSTKNIFLMHYPAWVNHLGAQRYDLMLAGHSHGGQVRIPLFGALIVPFGVERYVLGMFRTAVGPLYVNPGIGWFPVPLRFNCRPEITVFEI